MKDELAILIQSAQLDAQAVLFARKGAYLRFGKRAFDLVFAALALILAAPVIALLWGLVRRDGGAGFYGQIRVGQGGRTFVCWKLRSMVVGADQALGDLCAQSNDLAREWARNQKLADDPRITRLGRLMRKSHLDELPQLWNVLIGDMSIVGARPFTPDQMTIYRSAGGQAYFHLRPGLTGLWQIASLAPDRNTFVQRVLFDERYVRSISWFGDIKIIAKTFVVVLRMNGQ